MSSQKMWEFAKDFAVPLSLLMVAYATLTAIRQFRDLFADSVFRASNGGEDAPPSFFLVADVGGGVAAFSMLMIMATVKEAHRSLNVTLLLVCILVGVALAATVLFNAGVIGGLVWQFFVSIGMFGGLTVLVPIWDRIVAVSPMSGATCTFIVFTADMMGYFVSTAMVFWRRFAAGEDETPEVVLSQFNFVLTGGGILSIGCIVLSALYFRARKQREEAGNLLRSGEFS